MGRVHGRARPKLHTLRVWNHSSPEIVLRVTTKVGGNGIPANSSGRVPNQASTLSSMTIRLHSEFGRRKSTTCADNLSTFQHLSRASLKRLWKPDPTTIRSRLPSQ